MYSIKNKATGKRLLIDTNKYNPMTSIEDIMNMPIWHIVKIFYDNMEEDTILTIFDDTAVLVSQIIDGEATKPYMIDIKTAV